MIIAQMLRNARAKWPEKTALWFGEQAWTFAELEDQSAALARGLLAAGVEAGDRVAVFMPNCPELVLAYAACFRLGAVAAPLNYRYRTPEAEYALGHAGAKLLIVHKSLFAEAAPLDWQRLGLRRGYVVDDPAPPPPWRPFRELLAAGGGALPDPDFDPRQPVAILYTSGSTAKPKGVVYSQGGLAANCDIQIETFAFTPDDVHLVSTAACHAAAFTGQLLPGLASGGACVLTHLPRPERVVQEIVRRRVSRVQMLPATLEDLVEHLEQNPGKDLSSWRCCTSGGDVVPVDLHHRFARAVGFEITELYGMTEVLSCITNPPFGPKRAGSIGLPAAQTEAHVDGPAGEASKDGGELLVRSPAMMTGYWNDPENTAAALAGGWMHTGDLARRDADGFFWFVGRKKEIIIHGGSNISPLEVEEVLDEHPAVRLSCVVGLPDDHWGQTVAAYVALRPDAAPRPTGDELRQFVAARIAAYKTPERVRIVDELPLGPTGKVDRHTILARALSGEI